MTESGCDQPNGMECRDGVPPDGLNSTQGNDTSHRECSCWQAIRYALTQQALVLVVSVLVRDGGIMFVSVLYAMLLSWCPMAIIVCRQATHRTYTPSKIHLAIIRHSFWVFVIGALLIHR